MQRGQRHHPVPPLHPPPGQGHLRQVLLSLATRGNINIVRSLSTPSGSHGAETVAASRHTDVLLSTRHADRENGHHMRADKGVLVRAEGLYCLMGTFTNFNHLTIAIHCFALI